MHYRLGWGSKQGGILRGNYPPMTAVRHQPGLGQDEIAKHRDGGGGSFDVSGEVLKGGVLRGVVFWGGCFLGGGLRGVFSKAVV